MHSRSANSMRFEAIVIGGGPAGSSAGLALARQGRSVAIIERGVFPRRKVCGEFMSAVNLELLDQLGVGEAVRALAGPEVKRVALFAAGSSVEASMPSAARNEFGRALGRDVLDGLLLDAARAAGVAVFQPWRATEIRNDGKLSSVRIENRQDNNVLAAPVVIAAHGSWEAGKLQSNLGKINGPRDFLGFKAHFTGATLSRDVMPLLMFPGGYGGMVWADRDRLSLSCCIRRDALNELRRQRPRQSAADAVLAHILASCPSAANALGGATLHEEWLAAGPIRPGIRSCYLDDIFRVGNLAGESHPIIAEGISMAIQSGWMLARMLGRSQCWDRDERIATGRCYSHAWRRQFRIRILAASFLANLSIHPLSAAAVKTFVRLMPISLSIGASLSGKTKTLSNSY
jgi:menaquinone-9 beta-reductase